MIKKVAVIMGSDSDFPVVKNCIKTLKSFGVPVEVRVLSAHRTPDEAALFSRTARQNGFGLDAAAVCLADALQALFDLTGENASDATIEEVFETFCVGK